MLLEPGQKVRSGLGYIEYYENWNEPDKTWEGEESHFTAQELAAMASADYDGHEGRIGDTYGVKNADADAKLVLGGVAGASGYINYLNEMKAWAEANRSDKQLPFDVLNFHFYTGKNSPENSNLIETIDNIVAWKNANASDKEVWMTEFGWDTNLGSPHGATQKDQSNFLIRTYLIANAHGIDRSTMYMSRDASSNVNDNGKYATSGLTTLSKRTKKESWYGVYALKNALTGYTFKEIIKEDSNIYIYKFTNDTTKEDCYVLWSPTQDGSTINNYSLNIGNSTEAKLEMIESKNITPLSSDLTINNGTVSVNVSETPIFVKVNQVKEHKALEFDVTLFADKTELKQGDEFSLNLSINHLSLNDDEGLKSISGLLQYSNNDLEIKNIENGNLDATISNGKLVINGNDNITSKGNVIKINFVVKENASTGLSVISLTDIIGNLNISTHDVYTNINISLKDNETNNEEDPSDNEDVPSDEEPTIDEPSEDTPSDEEPTIDEPSEDIPSNDEPTIDEPNDDTPSIEEPTTNEPSEDIPSNDEPIIDEPNEDTPSNEEPTNKPNEDIPSNQEVLEEEVKPVNTGIDGSYNGVREISPIIFIVFIGYGLMYLYKYLRIKY